MQVWIQNSQQHTSSCFANLQSVESKAWPRGRLDAEGGVLVSYMHASPAPGLGRMAAVVRLESSSGRLEGAAADVAQVGGPRLSNPSRIAAQLC